MLRIWWFFTFLLLTAFSAVADSHTDPSGSDAAAFAQAREANVTGRDSESYMRRLGFSEEEVVRAGQQKQKWLSVGEGRAQFVAQAFARGVDAWGLDATVKNPHIPERSIIGLAQKMPFADESFDRVVSVQLINYFFDPKRFNDPDAGKKAIQEMIRVVKVGGDIRINPVDQGKSLIAHLRELEKDGRVSIELLPTFKPAYALKDHGPYWKIEVDPAGNNPMSVRIVRKK